MVEYVVIADVQYNNISALNEIPFSHYAYNVRIHEPFLTTCFVFSMQVSIIMGVMYGLSIAWD